MEDAVALGTVNDQSAKASPSNLEAVVSGMLEERMRRLSTLADAIVEAHDNAIVTHSHFPEISSMTPVSMWPEVIAAAHNNAIIAHNHFVRLRRAAMVEGRRVVNAEGARWERLCRRWAAKH